MAGDGVMVSESEQGAVMECGHVSAGREFVISCGEEMGHGDA